MSHRRAVQRAGIAVLGLWALLALLIVLAQYISLPLGVTSPAGTSRFNLVVTIGAAVGTAVLLVRLVTVVLEDQRPERAALLVPLVALATALASLFAVLALSSLDQLRHGYRITWRWLLDPDVRLLLTGIYLALVASLGWIDTTLARLRGDSWRSIGTLYLGMLLTVVAVALAAARVGV